MTYTASPTRYDTMTYRRAGRSGLTLPALSLGLWHNFGGVDQEENSRALLRYAFDHGITHFDLANNYGPLPGSAEQVMGRMLATDFAPYRDEMIISTKAGFDYWDGPYGRGGSRKYLTASLDRSLKHLGIDYVDVFYSHVPDYETPFEETMKTLIQFYNQGKALYLGISNYRTPYAKEALQILKDEGVPAVLHQPPYNMLNRWVLEEGFLDVMDDFGCGVISFSPLAQGLLTNKYLTGIPAGSRAAKAHGQLNENALDEPTRTAIEALHEIAQQRGQSLAQMALAWNLRHPQMTSVIIGASKVEQIADNLEALNTLSFSSEELERIDAICSERLASQEREKVPSYVSI